MAIREVPDYILIRLRGYLEEEQPIDSSEERIARSLLGKLVRSDTDLTQEEEELFEYLVQLGPIG